ncbi:MAG: hypothetical protein RL037_1045 [Bacteroidota bacterium]|jgi:hypothetical protein
MIKILVDRQEPNAEIIRSRQDFKGVLKSYERQRKLFHNPWFFGVVGFSCLILSLLVLLPI